MQCVGAGSLGSCSLFVRARCCFSPTSIPEEMEGKISLIIYSQRKSLSLGALTSSLDIYHIRIHYQC